MAQRTAGEQMAIDLAGIRWFANEIENLAVERYMGTRSNIVQIVEILRATRQRLRVHDAKLNPQGMKDSLADCPWERCQDWKCMPDCGTNSARQNWPAPSGHEV